MAEQTELPEWADRVRRTYLRGESSLFLLHNNVFDHVLYGGQLYALHEFLAGPLLDRSKQTIAVYDPSSRLRVRKRVPEATALDAALGKRQASEVLPAL